MWHWTLLPPALQIINGADLEYTKSKHLKCHSWLSCFVVYTVSKKKWIPINITINYEIKYSARLAEKTNSLKECIEIIIHV